jgi:hypothetical protein
MREPYAGPQVASPKPPSSVPPRVFQGQGPPVSPFALFKRGLAFHDQGESHLTDAADAYRRALSLWSGHVQAERNLEIAERTLVPLAGRARAAATGLVRSDEFFHYYLSPFEAFPFEETGSDKEPDPKAIQRAKKTLLNEIQLEGKVWWLDGYALDPSLAHKLDDELLDPNKTFFHRAIFRNKSLLRFLTRGDIEHFLYARDYFSQATLDLLDDEPAFRAFLSKPFARQYNFVLTRAIKQRLLPVVEVLLCGRRWVEPDDEHICFEGATQRIEALVEEMRGKATDGRAKVSLREMDDFLRERSLPELINHLPSDFDSLRTDLLMTIRSIAIDSANEHNDLELAKGILGLSNKFACRNISLTKKLEEDFRTIEQLLAEDLACAFSALVWEGRSLEIGRGGIAYNGLSMTSTTIEAVRWGVLIQKVNGDETDRTFEIRVRNADSLICVKWSKPGFVTVVKNLFRKSGTAKPIAELSIGEQEVHFERMITAALHHLVPTLISKLIQKLRVGDTVVIGPCTLTQQGIGFKTRGWVFEEDCFVGWRDVITETRNGQMIISSKTQHEIAVSLALIDTDNAVLMPILVARMEKELGTDTIATECASKPASSPDPISKRRVVWERLTVIGFLILVVLLALSDLPTDALNKSGASSPSKISTARSWRDSEIEKGKATPRTRQMESFAEETRRQRSRTEIEIERGKAARMIRELESLAEKIRKQRLVLDERSDSEIADFNGKVDRHNTLLVELQDQERRINQLVDDYNETVRLQGGNETLPFQVR